MSTNRVEIISPAMDELLARGLQVDTATQQAMQDRLAEHAIAWQIQLKGPAIQAPGEGLWPVGSIHNLGKRNERYGKGGRDSGRSLAGWDLDQTGLTLKATNTAVDARRNRYAEHVHFAGDPTGRAVEDAADAFGEEMEAAVEEMTDILERALLGVV